MAANNNEMKNVFMSGDKRTMLYMLDYIKKNLGITEADYSNHIGYYVIYVPKDQYEHALLNGRNFACKEDFGIYWIDYYDERREPIAACDIGYGLLPKTLIPGEEKEEYDNRRLWGYYDEHTPKTILEYFDSMKDFLKVDKIIREYHSGDDALTISPLDPDYETKSKLFRKFVEKYGYGPFREIHLLKLTGEYVKEPILARKKKK